MNRNRCAKSTLLIFFLSIMKCNASNNYISGCVAKSVLAVNKHCSKQNITAF